MSEYPAELKKIIAKCEANIPGYDFTRNTPVEQDYQIGYWKLEEIAGGIYEPDWSFWAPNPTVFHPRSPRQLVIWWRGQLAWWRSCPPDAKTAEAIRICVTGLGKAARYGG